MILLEASIAVLLSFLLWNDSTSRLETHKRAVALPASATPCSQPYYAL